MASSTAISIRYHRVRFSDANNRHNRERFASPEIATQIREIPRFTGPSSLSHFALRCHIYRKHTGTYCRSQRRTDGRDGGGGVLIPGAVRVTMSVRGMKVWIMTAVCTGLMGLVAGDAHAFCGKAFKKKDACADPCATACADTCGKGGGLKNWFGGMRAKWAPANDCCAAPCGPVAPCGPAVAGPAHAPAPMPAPAPTTQRVKVTEWVPTWVEEEVTVCRPVKKIEAYTAYRYECVPETITCQVTVNRMITETVTENRCVTERVAVQKTVTVNERVPVMKTVTCMERRPVQKQVTCYETHWKTVMVTEMQSKTVTHKVQVPYCETKGPSLMDKIHAKCDPCYTPCPRTVSGCRTEKQCETVCCPVTKCKKVCETVPVTKTVCTYECVPVTKQVCTYECVPVTKQITCYECVTKVVPTAVTRTRCVPTVENQTKTVNVRKCVAYQATREVCVNEMVKEKVKVCKMVARVVEKDVVVAAPCGAPCGNACGAPCGNPCDTGCGKAGLFDRLKGKMGGKKHKGGDCCAPAAACGAAAGCCH